MKNIKIAMNGINDLTELVKNASKVDSDIMITKGRFTIDAKSIMGVMSIDMSTGVTVEYPEDAADFENFIKEFAV